MSLSRTSGSVIFVLTAIALLFVVSGCSGGGGGGGGGGSSQISIYTALAAADLNLDGLDDIAAPRERFKIQGTGTGFEPKDIHFLATIELQDSLRPGSFNTYDTQSADGSLDKLDDYPVSVDLGDLNNDLFPDLAIADTNSVNITLQNMNDAGQFFPHRVVQTEPGPIDVDIGDLDGDGNNDIAVASEPLTLLINDPLSPGTQLTAQSIPVNASSVAVGDMNGDGRIDIAATGRDEGDDKVYVIMQEKEPAPPGVFISITAYPVGFKPVAVIAADLNGDTLLDLAIVNEGLDVGSVSVMLQDNSMPGTFMAQEQYTTGRGSDDIDVGDLNGDLLPDLVVSNKDEENISLLFQDALVPGRFEPAETLPIKKRIINDVIIGEFTGDLLLDIAIASQDGVFVYAQENNNPGEFLPGEKI
jgi:hypothetical protein